MLIIIKEIRLLGSGFKLNMKVYISTTGGPKEKGMQRPGRYGKAWVKKHDFHIGLGLVDLKDQWDMQRYPVRHLATPN